MHGAKERRTVVVDRYTRFCLTAITILMTVLILGLWATGPVGPSPSGAAPAPAGTDGIGNPGVQRAAMVKAIETTNHKLDQIIRLLESGKIKVRVVEDEGQNARAKAKESGK